MISGILKADWASEIVVALLSFAENQWSKLHSHIPAFIWLFALVSPAESYKQQRKVAGVQRPSPARFNFRHPSAPALCRPVSITLLTVKKTPSFHRVEVLELQSWSAFGFDQVDSDPSCQRLF